MQRLNLLHALAVGVAAISTACNADGPTAAESDSPLLAAQGGGSSNNTLLGDVASGDYVDPTMASPLTSTCPAPVKGSGWSLNFEHTQCLIVQPDWNTDSGFEPYALTDDIVLGVLKKQGKDGQITYVRFYGQDVIGEAGIAHNSDTIPVAVPVIPTKSGFVLHVHAPRVAIWRLSGHTGGDRVALIGWVSIGDLVYRPQ
ncbi:MAG: hypothetical protein HYT81_06860 [Gemmatimonadetes bacterium]|nr:hypothetical protein [Gemmatimonadota bacterium]